MATFLSLAASGYTEPRVDHSQSPSEPERGYANGGTHRDEGRPFTRYIGTLYTIRVQMTVVEVELKPFALQ